MRTLRAPHHGEPEPAARRQPSLLSAFQLPAQAFFDGGCLAGEPPLMCFPIIDLDDAGNPPAILSHPLEARPDHSEDFIPRVAEWG